MMATHELRWKVGDPFLDALEGRMITPRVLEQAWRDVETGEVEWVPVPEARVNQRSGASPSGSACRAIRSQ